MAYQSNFATNFTVTMQNATFADINSLVGITSLPEVVLQVNAINNQMFNLINCPTGHRFMRPEAGMDIMKFLQEPCDALTAYQLFNHMVYALQKWIGGITLNLPGCYVNPLPSGNGFDTAFPYTINAVNLQSVGKFVISRPHTSS